MAKNRDGCRVVGFLKPCLPLRCEAVDQQGATGTAMVVATGEEASFFERQAVLLCTHVAELKLGGEFPHGEGPRLFQLAENLVLAAGWL